jgi:small subunit ribosomal protein S4
MGKHAEPKCRQCRREGERLLLKGERCATSKCALARRNSAPGQHGASTKKPSDYAIRMREKQKLRRIYGLSEKQLRNYFEVAKKTPGVTGTQLLQLLERRMDNVVFRLGLAASRTQSRELVKHGHFKINGYKVDLPSYALNANDVVTIKEKSVKFLEGMIQKTKEARYPSWIMFNADTKEGKINGLPVREDIDYPISEQLIVEYYSK